MMDTLEKIEKVLSENQELGWHCDQPAPPHHPRARGSRYRSVSLIIWPKNPIPNVYKLQQFTQKEIVDKLARLSVKHYNMAKCYQYPSMGKQFIKLGAIYYYEPITDPTEPNGLEREIIISVYPCEELARSRRIREVIQIKTRNCSNPCKLKDDCFYKSGRIKLAG